MEFLLGSVGGRLELRRNVMKFLRDIRGCHISLLCVGVELSSRSVSRQVFSPLQSLTSVFGMGTGGPSALKSPTFGGRIVNNSSYVAKRRGAPSGIRTRDPLIKSQLLYQLS